MAEVMQGDGRNGSATSLLSLFYSLYEHVILPIVTFLIFLIVWEGLSRGWWFELLAPILGEGAKALHVPPLFISAPTRIAATTYELVRSGEIFKHLWVSGQAFFLGGALAAILGIPIGLVVGWYRWINYAGDPFLSAMNATPQVVFVPLIIIWVGTGLISNTLIVFMLTVLPISMSTLSGVRTTDSRYLKVAKSFGSSQRFLFTSVIFPNTVPFILTGLRLGVGRAMVGIVVGEIYGSAEGLGYMINVAGMSFQTDKVFVGITVMALVGLALVGIIQLVERRVERWRPAVTSN